MERTTWFGIEKPFPWLLCAITAAEVLAATAACVTVVAGAFFAVARWAPVDLNDVL